MAETAMFKLMELPDEILLMVLRHLDFDSLLGTTYVSRRFLELAEPFLYESITVLHGDKARHLTHQLVKEKRRSGWVRTLLISTKFGQEHALMKLPTCIRSMDNLQDLRLETPDCNQKKPEDRVDWIALQDQYEKIFYQSSVLISDRTHRLLPNLKSCVLHFVDTHTELYSMSRYSSIFLHPTLESLTISCMSTDVPANLFKNVSDVSLYYGTTSLKFLHLEECDLHPPSLELILNFPHALKSLKISEGTRYDGIFGTGSSRMHGNVEPQAFARTLVNTCKDSLESLSLALGHLRSASPGISQARQYLDLHELRCLRHLEVNNRTLNLIRTRPNCDHNTWKRLPPSLESFKIFAIPLLPPQHDTQNSYIPLQSCLIREKQLHGTPRLRHITYSYEHYESNNDEEMNFNDLLMNLVYHEANGNPPAAVVDATPDPPLHRNPILNLLHQAVGVVNQPQPQPQNTAQPANTNFVTAAMNPDLDVPPQNLQPPRFRWRTGPQQSRRQSCPELSRCDAAKLGLLNALYESHLSYFFQTQTRLQIDIVALPRGFIPPFLFPEDKPNVHEAWFNSVKPLTPEKFIECVRKSREATRLQTNRGVRGLNTSGEEAIAYGSERARARRNFMARVDSAQSAGNWEPDLDEDDDDDDDDDEYEDHTDLADIDEVASELDELNDANSDAVTEEDEEDDDETSVEEMEIEDVLQMLVAEAHAGHDTADGGASDNGSIYVDADTEIEMSEAEEMAGHEPDDRQIASNNFI